MPIGVNAPRDDHVADARAPQDLSGCQRWLFGVISHPDGVLPRADPLLQEERAEALEAVVTRSSRQTAGERLLVYAQAYHARLIEALRSFFPALCRVLGQEVFDGFALGYLQKYPSRSYNVGRLGAHFAQYLAETRPEDRRADHQDGPPSAGWPDLLIDLATFEWAIAEVFDGPGPEGQRTLQAEDIPPLSLERGQEIGLTTVPCLRLLRFRFDINGYWESLRRCEPGDEPAPPEPRESFVALNRSNFVVRRHDLSLAQYELLASLQRGESLGAGLRRAAALSDLDDAALAACLSTWFREWGRWQIFGPPALADRRL